MKDRINENSENQEVSTDDISKLLQKISETPDLENALSYLEEIMSKARKIREKINLGNGTTVIVKKDKVGFYKEEPFDDN